MKRRAIKARPFPMTRRAIKAGPCQNKYAGPIQAPANNALAKGPSHTNKCAEFTLLPTEP